MAFFVPKFLIFGWEWANTIPLSFCLGEICPPFVYGFELPAFIILILANSKKSTSYCVTHNNEPYALVKPIIENMGLDWRSQATKLRSNKKCWGG